MVTLVSLPAPICQGVAVVIVLLKGTENANDSNSPHSQLHISLSFLFSPFFVVVVLVRSFIHLLLDEIL